MAELFAPGLQFGESPRSHDGRFWMCDWRAGEVLAFDADGDRQVVARVDGMPFSTTATPAGRTASCSSNRSMCRTPGAPDHASRTRSG